MKSSLLGVIATNDDAAMCKWSCSQLGYYNDTFVKYFIKDPTKRPPLINRGYYSRVAAFRKIISQFIHNTDCKKQIVSLGAGFDTTFFNLKADNKIGSNVIFYEIDLEEVVRRKISIISKHQELKDLISGSIIDDQRYIHSSNYHLVSVDLNSVSGLNDCLQSCNIDVSAPTLFLSECVLIYLKPDRGDDIIKWVSSTFRICSFCTYEQIHPSDAFGVVMLQNLEKRGCPLQSIQAFPTLSAQHQRYLNLGWQRTEAKTMLQIYNTFLDKQDVQRVQKIEFMDEFEEWELIQEHYCIVIAFQHKTQTEQTDTFWSTFHL